MAHPTVEKFIQEEAQRFARRIARHVGKMLMEGTVGDIHQLAKRRTARKVKVRDKDKPRLALVDPTPEARTSRTVRRTGQTSRTRRMGRTASAVSTRRTEEPLPKPGAALVALIRRSGKSQADFAADLRISPSHLCNIIAGRHTASPEVTERIMRLVRAMQEGEERPAVS